MGKIESGGGGGSKRVALVASGMTNVSESTEDSRGADVTWSVFIQAETAEAWYECSTSSIEWNMYSAVGCVAAGSHDVGASPGPAEARTRCASYSEAVRGFDSWKPDPMIFSK